MNGPVRVGAVVVDMAQWKAAPGKPRPRPTAQGAPWLPADPNRVDRVRRGAALCRAILNAKTSTPEPGPVDTVRDMALARARLERGNQPRPMLRRHPIRAGAGTDWKQFALGVDERAIAAELDGPDGAS